MQLSFASSIMLLASLASALPGPTAAKPKPVKCPSGYTHYVSKFDDLGLNKGGKTNAINASAGAPTTARPYQRLFYDELAWQFASNGEQTITNDPQNTHFDMTSKSGKGAIVSVGIALAQNKFSTYYGGEYFNLNGFAVRGEYPEAFNLYVHCTAYPKNKPSYVVQKAVFAIPASPAGALTTVTLTAAQKARFARLDECFFADSEDEASARNHIVLDDIDYCFIDE